MRIQKTLSPDQIGRLRDLGAQERTPPGELLLIARSLERYLHDQGDLQQLRRDQMNGFPGAPAPLFTERDAFSRLEDEGLVFSSGVIHTSHQRSVGASDRTFAAVTNREEAAAQLDGAQSTRIPSALLWAYTWLRPWLYPSIETSLTARHRARYLNLLAQKLGTTERKLIEKTDSAQRKAMSLVRLTSPAISSVRPKSAMGRTDPEHPCK